MKQYRQRRKSKVRPIKSEYRLEEFEQIQTIAQAKGMKVASFQRRAVLAYIRKKEVVSDEIKELLARHTVLSKRTVTLTNQQTKYAHTHQKLLMRSLIKQVQEYRELTQNLEQIIQQLQQPLIS